MKIFTDLLLSGAQSPGKVTDLFTFNLEAGELFFGAVFFPGNFRGDEFRYEDGALPNVTARVTGNGDMKPTVFGIEIFEFVVGRSLKQDVRLIGSLGVHGRSRF